MDTLNKVFGDMYTYFHEHLAMEELSGRAKLSPAEAREP